jgi:hypothetical protein
MAKKTSDYLQGLFTDAGYTAEEITQIMGKLSPKLPDTQVYSDDEWKAQAGRVNAITAEKDRIAKEAADTVAAYQDWYKKAQESLAKKTEEDPGTGFDEKKLSEKFATREDMLKLLQENANVTGTIVKSVGKVTADHWKRFGEPPDLDALDTFARDNKFTDVERAYEKFIQPKVEEQQAKKLAEKIAAAKQEGIEEGRRLSMRNGFPNSVDPTPTSPFFERLAGKDADGNSRNDVLNDLMDTYVNAGREGRT